MYHKNVNVLDEFRADAFLDPYPLEKQSFSLFSFPVITFLLLEHALHDQKSSSSHQCQQQNLEMYHKKSM